MNALAGVAVALTWLLLAGGAWFLYSLLRQNGRLLLRIEALEEQVRARGFGDRSLAGSKIKRDGLAPGTPAPAFALPTVDNRTLTLKEYEGHRVLLVFSDPACVPCNALAPRLQRLAREMSGVQVVMISRGDADSNRQKVDEHGLTFPVAMQRHWEVSQEYGKFVTPMAYLIDEQGIIATHAAVGVDEILNLLAKSAPVAAQSAESAAGITH